MYNVNTLYENIRKRRLALNMSQQELAEAVGYSNKSMVSHVENGKIDLPVTMIKKFAEALNTTPSDLMGWEDFVDDVQKGNVDIDDLQHAIDMYRKYKGVKSEVKNMVDYLLETGFEIETNRQD